jgi:hypothetical protein
VPFGVYVFRAVASLSLSCVVLLLAGSLRAESSLTENLSSSLTEYNEGARFPLPALSEGQLRRLSSGKVVRIRDQISKDGGPQRITGLLVCDAQRDDLWVAFRDPHLTSLPELTEVRISEDGTWPTNWYQYFHMPGPFGDRHWVIAVDDNIALAKQSDGRLWEHFWGLQPGGPELATQVVSTGEIPGVDSEMADKAIYPPVNEGAWLLVQLGQGRTLLGYTVRASIGGNIPDRMVASYSMLTLARLLRRVEDRASVAADHYDAAHPRIRDGGGEALR